MANKLRAVRWLGTSGTLIDSRGEAIPDGVPSGVLHLRDRIVYPGEEITAPEELAEIGEARIEELVQLQRLQYIDSSPKPKAEIRDESSPREKALADLAFKEAKKYSAIASNLWAADKQAGFVDDKGEPTAAQRARVISMGGANK
jgi:hypothetical protein